ncbi:hypothetical protein K2173_000647 [Erythroxylum novogranatense]|uniref:Uncharacterized protein n=1 Tax=Erythroxylum novogranatense TaxID=1862640 RepID=A0AAV8S7V8_9ROSI|nr:hypothetical protein K2173_000647 [Erythroxylum novogranatense]
MANADAEAVDFKPKDDDLMDDDIDASPHATHLPKLKSAITGGASSFSSAHKKTKAHGFRKEVLWSISKNVILVFSKVLESGLKVKEYELLRRNFSETGCSGFGIQEHIDLGIK